MDKEHSIGLLCRPSKVFEHHKDLSTSCIEIANSVKCLNYMSLPSVQELVTRVWTGPFSNDLSFLQIFLTLICPPCASYGPMKLKYQHGHFQVQPDVIFDDVDGLVTSLYYLFAHINHILFVYASN